MIPVLPGWVRAVGNVSDGDRTELACRAGGALAFVGIALDSPSAHSGCWLDRLALRAAAVTVALGGRTEGEAEIRDAWHLTRPDQDAGPAGRTFGLWRRLAGRSAPLAEPDLLVAAAQGLGCRTAEAAGDAIEIARDLATGALPPLAAVAAVVAASERRCPGLPTLSLLLADAVLAHRLRWPMAVPLLAVGLERRPFRSDAPDWPAVCLAALSRGCGVAWDLYGEIGRRAERLQAVRGRLRSRMAGAVVEAMLATDALSPARLPGGLSDRAGRRLVDRLVALGAVRELTGRSTFRLYGL